MLWQPCGRIPPTLFCALPQVLIGRVEKNLTNAPARPRPARLPRNDDDIPPGFEAPPQTLQLGCFAAAVNAFQADENSVSQAAIIAFRLLRTRNWDSRFPLNALRHSAAGLNLIVRTPGAFGSAGGFTGVLQYSGSKTPLLVGEGFPMPDEKKSHLTLYICIGIVAAGVTAFAAPLFAMKPHVGGEIFLRLLKMMVVPLVMASVMSGIIGLGDVRKLGRPGGRTILFYLATTILAVIIGLILSVDWFLDRFRTATNAFGDAVGLAVVEKSFVDAPEGDAGASVS